MQFLDFYLHNVHEKVMTKVKSQECLWTGLLHYRIVRKYFACSAFMLKP
jgi:hypothetical protein